VSIVIKIYQIFVASIVARVRCLQAERVVSMALFDENDNVICEGYLYKTKPIDKLKLLTVSSYQCIATNTS